MKCVCIRRAAAQQEAVRKNCNKSIPLSIIVVPVCAKKMAFDARKNSFRRPPASTSGRCCFPIWNEPNYLMYDPHRTENERPVFVFITVGLACLTLFFFAFHDGRIQSWLGGGGEECDIEGRSLARQSQVDLWLHGLQQ